MDIIWVIFIERNYINTGQIWLKMHQFFHWNLTRRDGEEYDWDEGDGDEGDEEYDWDEFWQKWQIVSLLLTFAQPQAPWKNAIENANLQIRRKIELNSLTITNVQTRLTTLNHGGE